MKLETERLILREFALEDVAAVHSYAGNPLVAAHMIWGPNTEQETFAFVCRTIEMREREPRVDYELALERKEDGVVIGGCGFHLSEPRQAEIGYCLHPAYWRQGYASEAAAALLAYGFGEHGLHRIFATCRPANIGSAKVMEAVGMTYEGRLKEHMWHKGAWHDSLLYAILEQDYRPRSRPGDAT
ncbi:N-acetyltransferase [Paenibacillus sp. J31TS4]|uniref:GNAT family N-acetyltransferase n=1 Tax=Paenibacillus sp. J31TS4 TaxID=2807195 RepID=UPI001B2C05B9|nr:GNAT family protein [Paenibacillus sp. J31TS4]GIP37964.1 N-acetyltransferase [Paenibacillus sp. J31TS4]